MSALKTIIDKNIEYENNIDDITIGKKIKAIFEANLLRTGKIEVSNIQLADITGKEIKIVNRDMKLEFGTILKRFGKNKKYGQDHDYLLMQQGVNMLSEGVRLEEEPDDRGRMRPVYYFSGLALTQLLSRWDPSIRFLINVTIHRLTEHLHAHNVYPTSMSDMDDDMLLCIQLLNELQLSYMLLRKETDLEHIKENYEATLSKLEEKRQEVILLQKKKREVYPSLTRIVDEIREIDKECADIISKNAKELDYENERDAKLAFSRE